MMNDSDLTRAIKTILEEQLAAITTAAFRWGARLAEQMTPDEKRTKAKELRSMALGLQLHADELDRSADDDEAESLVLVSSKKNKARSARA